MKGVWMNCARCGEGIEYDSHELVYVILDGMTYHVDCAPGEQICDYCRYESIDQRRFTKRKLTPWEQKLREQNSMAEMEEAILCQFCDRAANHVTSYLVGRPITDAMREEMRLAEYLNVLADVLKEEQ